MFIVCLYSSWFRTDKGLYALIERAMAYCWLGDWDNKKRHNQTAIPFIHVPNKVGARIYPHFKSVASTDFSDNYARAYLSAFEQYHAFLYFGI